MRIATSTSSRAIGNTIARFNVQDDVLSAQTLKLLNEANDEKRRWTYLLAAPEFQLK